MEDARISIEKKVLKRRKRESEKVRKIRGRKYKEREEKNQIKQT